ncbi:hypothetical protein KDW07_24230, partial [Burkholderia dolosa]
RLNGDTLDFPHVLFAPHCFALSHPASAHPVCARRGEWFADADTHPRLSQALFESFRHVARNDVKT